MDIRLLRARHKVQLRNGDQAVIVHESADGIRIKIRSLISPDNMTPVDWEELVSGEEIEVPFDVADISEWGAEVGVVLHIEREAQNLPDIYKATTMSSVPYGVIITAESEQSGYDAIRQLLSSLRVFGFKGRLHIHDVTTSGISERYTVDV